ncbi:putative pentatricopeptide repeat-containing protein At5g43820 [Cryptomeria japonica]|uniref:putative pentatricopeptide repeat-containing protein At5g43820 n=1 Tax=Cryptomeria japonica TaxID=3369 RepID=UPI0025AD3ED3|nr:putative pentatricopeptide repeat-containing protein At5g43820 [Cryptomeria japonica]
MAARGKILWVMDICVDWTRRPKSRCLLLKWCSLEPKSHLHQCPQSIARSSSVKEGTADNSDINQSIVAEEEDKLISLEEREMDSRPKMQNQYDELLSRHSSTVPSRKVTGIDDQLTDYEKICGVFLQKLKGKAAVEAAFAQTGVILTSETIERVVKRASLSGQALLTFFRWAGKQPNCQHNLNSYNDMLSGLGRRKYFDQMEGVLHQMNTQGPSPTFKTIDIVMTRYIKGNRIAEAVKTFDRMEEFGLMADTAVLNTLLHRLCQDNHTGSAHCLLNKMRKKIRPDNITYSIIIGGWAKQGRIKEIYRTLKDMSELNLKPDCITYNYVLEGLFRAGRNIAAVKLLKNMSVKGCSPTTTTYNTVIKHLCLGGSLNEGLTYYNEMLAKGCKPNNTTYSLLIRFLIKARRVAESLEFFNLMLEGGVIPEVGTVNSFIEPLCKFGPPDAALQFYKQMKLVGCDPNSKTYKLLLMRLGRFGFWDQMMKLWHEMEESGWTSDVEVYTYIVNGFCNGRKLDEAAYFMGEALSKGFCPGRIICSKLIHKLIRARKAEVAYNIFRKLKDARRNDKIKRIQRSRGWQY